jgi:3-oxoacyl-[acyl-carrier protein] reductase
MTSSQPSLVVVIGGGTGMGRDIALDQTALGRDVLIVGRRSDPLTETARAAAGPGRVSTVVADASTAAGAAQILGAVGDRPVVGIVAAAGGQGGFRQPGSGPTAVEDAWTQALRVNLLTAVLPIEALLEQVPDTTGRIVLIGSTAGLDGAGGPYATAKAALAGYGRDLATRAGARGITVNTIAPGFVADTGFFEAGGFGDSSPMIDTAAARTLVGRVGQPRDITAGVRWLLSEDAGWVTGQTIAVDGGTVMLR